MPSAGTGSSANARTAARIAPSPPSTTIRSGGGSFFLRDVRRW
jgi:hypothetical protein